MDLMTRRNMLMRGGDSTDWKALFLGMVDGVFADTELVLPNDVTYIKGYCFRSTNLTKITIPTSVTSIANYGLNTPNLVVVFESATPVPVNYNSTFENSTVTIYVPDEAVADYKASNYYRNVIDKIHPISELNT